jgi:hypothetical protein
MLVGKVLGQALRVQAHKVPAAEQVVARGLGRRLARVDLLAMVAPRAHRALVGHRARQGAGPKVQLAGVRKPAEVRRAQGRQAVTREVLEVRRALQRSLMQVVVVPPGARQLTVGEPGRREPQVPGLSVQVRAQDGRGLRGQGQARALEVVQVPARRVRALARRALVPALADQERRSARVHPAQVRGLRAEAERRQVLVRAVRLARAVRLVRAARQVRPPVAWAPVERPVLARGAREHQAVAEMVRARLGSTRVGRIYRRSMNRDSRERMRVRLFASSPGSWASI